MIKNPNTHLFGIILLLILLFGMGCNRKVDKLKENISGAWYVDELKGGNYALVVRRDIYFEPDVCWMPKVENTKPCPT